MALLVGIGSPSATLGSDGDFYAQLDNSSGNRFFIGPKANGAWPQTYYSLQGPSGPPLIAVVGAPASAVGGVGQGAVDLATGSTYLKSASGWSQVAIAAFQGPIGAVGTVGIALGGSATTAGPQAGYTTATTTTANAVMPIPGTTQPQVYVPAAGGSFAGITYLNPGNSGSAVTFNLYDQTAGSVIYTSPSIPVGTIANVNPSVSMVAGNQHVWRISAGSGVLALVTPFYTVAASSSVGPSMWPTAALSQDTTYTSTAAVLRAVGATVAANGPAQYIYLPKAAYLQYATVSVTGSAAVTLTLRTSANNVIYTAPVTITASNTPYTTPVLSSTSVPLAASTSYFWYVTGSGTGQVYVNTSYVN